MGAGREILCAALSGASSEKSQWGPPLDPLVVLVCYILAQPIMPSIICSMNVPTDSTDNQHMKVIQMSTFKKKKQEETQHNPIWRKTIENHALSMALNLQKPLLT